MYLQILQNEKLILTKVAWRKKERQFLPVGPFHGAVIWIRIFWLENRFMRVNSRKPMHEYQYTVHLKPALTYFAYDKWMRRRMIKTALSSFIILCALSYRLQHLYSYEWLFLRRLCIKIEREKVHTNILKMNK